MASGKAGHRANQPMPCQKIVVIPVLEKLDDLPQGRPQRRDQPLTKNVPKTLPLLEEQVATTRARS